MIHFFPSPCLLYFFPELSQGSYVSFSHSIYLDKCELSNPLQFQARVVGQTGSPYISVGCSQGIVPFLRRRSRSGSQQSLSCGECNKRDCGRDPAFHYEASY